MSKIRNRCIDSWYTDDARERLQLYMVAIIFYPELPYDALKHLDSLPFTPMQHLFHLENKINNMKNNISQNISDSKKQEFYEIRRRNSNTKIDNIQEYLSDKIGVEKIL